jgi:hypothetical protein
MDEEMDFDVLESTICPICEKMVNDVFEIVAEKPFTAYSPMGGLTVWGPYDVRKQIICQGHSWVHFKFLHDDSERLILMQLPEYLKTTYGSRMD